MLQQSSMLITGPLCCGCKSSLLAVSRRRFNLGRLLSWYTRRVRKNTVNMRQTQVAVNATTAMNISLFGDSTVGQPSNDLLSDTSQRSPLKYSGHLFKK
jgi:hypothetical protein